MALRRVITLWPPDFRRLLPMQAEDVAAAMIGGAVFVDGQVLRSVGDAPSVDYSHARRRQPV